MCWHIRKCLNWRSSAVPTLKTPKTQELPGAPPPGPPPGALPLDPAGGLRRPPGPPAFMRSARVARYALFGQGPAFGFSNVGRYVKEAFVFKRYHFFLHYRKSYTWSCIPCQVWWVSQALHDPHPSCCVWYDWWWQDQRQTEIHQSAGKKSLLTGHHNFFQFEHCWVGLYRCVMV